LSRSPSCCNQKVFSLYIVTCSFFLENSLILKLNRFIVEKSCFCIHIIDALLTHLFNVTKIYTLDITLYIISQCSPVVHVFRLLGRFPPEIF
jgi:hypothetical protein